jgi:hypothetical protein
MARKPFFNASPAVRLPDFCRDQFNFMLQGSDICNGRHHLKVNKIRYLNIRKLSFNQVIGRSSRPRPTTFFLVFQLAIGFFQYR